MVGPQGVLSELDSAPDVLINNAGVSEGGGVPLWEVEKEVWDNVLGVNVHGTSTLPLPQWPLRRATAAACSASEGSGAAQPGSCQSRRNDEPADGWGACSAQVTTY
eukprot:COSAG04_NODE_2662_length_3767_cov_3.263063_4_plen_106_part_00